MYSYHTVQAAITELDSSLKGFEPIVDDTGKITGYKTAQGGADTVFPFSSKLHRVHLGSGNTFTSCTFSAISIPNYQSLTLDNFALIVTGINYGKDGSEGSGSYSYDPSTGTLRIIGTTCVQQTISGSYRRFYALYDVYCYYTD